MHVNSKMHSRSEWTILFRQQCKFVLTTNLISANKFTRTRMRAVRPFLFYQQNTDFTAISNNWFIKLVTLTSNVQLQQQQQQQSSNDGFATAAKFFLLRADIERFIEKERSSPFRITLTLLCLNLAWNLASRIYLLYTSTYFFKRSHY